MINYGVVVGRFQVPNLHRGHLELFRQVSSLHERVIVFIGVSASGPTKRNPLDFETRKKMIQADYPDFIFLPIVDRKYDEAWSIDLDEQIQNIARMGTVTLYGGRDSFLPHYKGKYKVHELVLPETQSGTEIRDKLTNRVMQSPDFRAGVIYSSQNQYKRTVMCVDIAILYESNSHGSFWFVLLGKKKGEEGWRFPGGHAEPGLSLEDNARKEAYEETYLDLQKLCYVGSFPVEDWRWEKEQSKITTALFVGYSMTKQGRPGDDIHETCWFPVSELTNTRLEPAHVPLANALLKYIGEKHENSTKPAT